MENPNEITYFAETDFRNERHRFGIKAKDRTRHVYVIGKTGMGKSTLIENMLVQDINNGNGLAFIDPHGGSAEKILDYIPKSRINDVVYFAPFDAEYPISFNVMEDVGYDKRHLVVAGLMSAFEKIWADQWSSRMAYILTNTLFALLEYPGSTLLDINPMLVDKEFRKKVVDNVKDPSIRSFWVDEFAKYSDRYAQDATPAIQNKVGQFVSNPLIRNIIGQPRTSFDIRTLMDEKKILIMNLSKGRIGEGNTNLLGSMLITKIYLAAMSRADLSETELASKPNFYFFVDEFQSFANKSFADILSEARKYKLNLTIAHQYIEQMEEEVRNAVFGNVGTMIVFRVGAFDAEIFEKEFAPEFMADDIVNLGFAQIYLRLMVDGIGSKPFSATTLLPVTPSDVSSREDVIDASRKNFASNREEVEKKIAERLSETGKKEEPKGGRTQTRDGKPDFAQKPRQDYLQKPRDNREYTKPKPKPKTDTPFKKAFAEAGGQGPKTERREERRPEQKPVSLNTLKRPDKKGSPTENKNQLKSALADILKDKPKDEKPKPVAPPASPKKAEKKPEPVKPNTTPQTNVGNKSDLKEVPEDVLKKILE